MFVQTLFDIHLVYRTYQVLCVQQFCGNSSVGRAQPCQGWGRGSESRFPLKCSDYESASFHFAQVAELVDAYVSGACAVRRAGSSPVLGTSEH